MTNRLLIILLTMLCALPLQAKDIIYAVEENNSYYFELLSLALSYSPEKNYQVKRYSDIIPKKRFFHLLANGNGIDVMKSHATLSRERDYRAIYFPILRGLKGWRIAIINKTRPELFRNVKTVKDLKKLKAMMFHTWITTDILNANNIKLVKGTDFEGMFKMLDRRRADYLPRSVLEVQQDLALYSTQNLMLDPYTVIAYPSAYYFYARGCVSNQNTTGLPVDE